MAQCRVVSWNLAYGKPGRFTTIENRRRQWALLGALAADIVLLQECRPVDLLKHAPTWMANEYRVAGHLERGWRLRSSLLVRHPHDLEPLELSALAEPQRRWLTHLPSTTAMAAVRVNGITFAAASVHALALDFDVGPVVTAEEFLALTIPGLKRPWYNEILASAIEPWVAGGRFIVGGDWNIAQAFDDTFPGRAFAEKRPSAEFFQRRHQAGWRDAMRRFHRDEVPTYIDPRSAPYELDHVFVDIETDENIAYCNVLDTPATRDLSDHLPIVVDLTF